MKICRTLFMRAALLVAVLAVAPAWADDAVGWSRVKVCLDANLPTLLRANSPVDTIMVNLHQTCAPQIEEAEQQASQAMTHLANLSQRAAAERYFRAHLDSAMRAYIERFAKVGGPTTLDPTR
jgi:hypothetical protein